MGQLHKTQRSPFDFRGEDDAASNNADQKVAESCHVYQASHCQKEELQRPTRAEQISVDSIVDATTGGQSVEGKARDPVAHSKLIAPQECIVRKSGAREYQCEEDTLEIELRKLGRALPVRQKVIETANCVICKS